MKYTTILLGLFAVASTAEVFAMFDPPEAFWTDAKAVALAKAIDHDDAKEIDKLVAHGADVNVVGKEDMVPLAWAALRHKKSAFRRLLEHGADPNHPVRVYDSPLHMAAGKADDAEWVRLALQHGGDPNLDTSAGVVGHHTPVFAAIGPWQKENLALLIAAAADVNYRDSSATTPILYAAPLRRWDTIYVLFKAGADWRLRDDAGTDLLYLLVREAGESTAENMHWRGKVIDWVVAQGASFRDAEYMVTVKERSHKEIESWANERRGRLRRWRELVPQSAVDYCFRGIAYAAHGAYDRSLADFSKAIEIAPDNAASYLMRGRARSEKAASSDAPHNDYGSAIDDFSQAIRLDPNHANAYVERAASWSKIKEPARALSDYSEAIRIDPTNAVLYWRRADVRRAMSAASKDIDGLNEALADCDKSLALVRYDPRTYRARADVLAALEHFDEALLDYSKAINRDPNHADAYAGRARCWLASNEPDRAAADQRQASAYTNRYAEWIVTGQFQLILGNLAHAIDEDPNDPRANAHLGLLLATWPDIERRDGARALEYATKACDLTSWEDPEALAALAEAHASLNHFDEAVKWQTRAVEVESFEKPKLELKRRLKKLEYDRAMVRLTEAVEADPSAARNYWRRAEARWRHARDLEDEDEFSHAASDEFKLALADCDRAIALDPQDAMAFFVRGKCRNGNIAKEIEDYTEAIRLDPTLDAAYVARASTMIFNATMIGSFRSKEKPTVGFDQAIDDLTTALRLNPKSDWAWYKRGDAWMARGQHAKAAEDYTHAVDLDPKYAEYYISRARAWIAVGENDKAIADCESALALKPGSREVLAIRGDGWFAKKEYDRAIGDFEAARESEKRRMVLRAAGRFQPLLDDLTERVKKYPEDSRTYDELAMLFAACRDPKFRDAKKSLEFARKACELTHWKASTSLGALAAAHAEAGDFSEAIKWQTKALEAAREDASKDEYQRRLALYQQGKPYREGDQTTERSVNGTE
jgi:tetratricopeptide (TPR) repeat protein